MSSKHEAGPSQPKGAHLRRSTYDRKRPLLQKELEYELNRILSDEENFVSSGSEVHYSDSDTESEEGFEEIVNEGDSGRAAKNASNIITATGWANDSQPPNNLKNIDFIKNQELIVTPLGNSPMDFFSLLFDDDFINFIVEETNKNAIKVLSMSISEKSRISAWKDLTAQEFRIFLGLMFHMGTIQLSRIQDYWKTDRLFNLPLFREHMSRNRFLLILRCLHFFSEEDGTDEPDKDVLRRIRKVLDYFNNKMETVYYPGRELSLDESMMLWRGRLSFRQYIKNETHKYGIKLYMLSEPNGTILRFRVYTGASDKDLSGQGHASKVVMNLMEGLLDNGHSLYMDNFYNSCTLSAALLERKTYSTGTLRVDRKENPSEIKKKLTKGENISMFKNGIHIGKWRDKRDVMYITTQYENEFDIFVNRRGFEVQKPRAILKYNQYMSGIDHQDQLLSYYPCERKTIRWYKKLFIHTAQLLMINSMKLFNAYSGASKMALYDFRLSVINGLLPIKPPPEVSTTSSRGDHCIVKITETYKDSSNYTRVKQKRCRQCTTDGKGRKRTMYQCDNCEEKPGLCPQCFDKYHSVL